MGKWTPERQAACVRNPDGTFKTWKGGRKKSELAKKENTAHGIKTHIGKEFKRQNGRVAKVGDVVRTKRKDGRYHQGAYWYLMTVKGWRVSPTQRVKPSKSFIERVKRQEWPR